jgi:hypothetical protein
LDDCHEPCFERDVLFRPKLPPILDGEDLSGSGMYIKFADDSILQVNNECQTYTKKKRKHRGP